MVKTGESRNVMSGYARNIGNAFQPPPLMQEWESLVPILSAGGTTSKAPLSANRRAYHVSWLTVLAYAGFVLACVVIGAAAGLTWLGELM